MIYTIELSHSRKYQTTSVRAALDFAAMFQAHTILSNYYKGSPIESILFMRP